MIVRQCLSSFGAGHRCALQEEHKAWHSDYRGTIWFNADPGEREWMTPADAERWNEIRRAEQVAQAEAAAIEAETRKLAAAKKIAHECIVVYGPRSPVTVRKPERARGAAQEKRRRASIEAALWLLTPEHKRTMAALKNKPEKKEPKDSDRWKSHHLLHPGAWMMQGLPEVWEADYDPFLVEIHADLAAAGIV